MKNLGKFFRSGLIAAFVASPVWADDTDIYLNNGAQTQGTTRVMLTMDFRANVGSTICNDAASAACKTIMGTKLYPMMDLYGRDGSRGADGFVDKDDYPDPNNPGPTIADTYWSGTKTNMYDVLRTVYRVVIDKVALKAATSTTINGLEMGFMVAHEGDCKGAGPKMLPMPGAKSACSQGAYILQDFIDIVPKANRQKLYFKMAAIPEPGIRPPWQLPNGSSWNGHSYKIRDMYLEFYRYITGKKVFNGYLGYSDYNSKKPVGNLYRNLPDNDVVFDINLDGNNEMWLQPDTDAMKTGSYNLANHKLSEAQYESPLDPNDACSAFYMINALFGTTGNSHRDTDTVIGASPNTTDPYGGMGVKLSGGQDAKDAQLVAAMYGTDWGQSQYGLTNIAGKQNVTTYVITDKVRTNTNAMAFAGGTGQAYPLSNPQAALDALESIVEEILSVSTTFVAASVPTNVFNRSRAVDNIYFALFQAEKEPLWDGNVKKLRIANLEVVDPNTNEVTYEKIIAQAPLTDPPVRAISNIDGRIKTDALTFWTDPAGADVVAFDASKDEKTGKDGRSITRGGSGQQIPGYLNNSIGNDNTGSRKMFTEDPNNPGMRLALDTQMSLSGISGYLDPNNILEPNDPNEHNERQLLGWIRGMDAFNTDPAKVTNSRPWLMSDPMHSRPLVVNYGAREGTAYSATNPDIRLFFGTNDGVIHFVRNTTTATSSNESGVETAAFIPLEMLSMQYTLSQNFAQLAPPHPYGMDGEAVSYVFDKDRDGNIENNSPDGDFVWVFIGQRRGGNGIYAFDLTNPDSPSLKWKIIGGPGGTAGFEQLGLTFSTPKAVTLDLGDALGTDDGASDTPVLIFAGGYNGGWNGNSRVGKDAGSADDTVGNAIYVVNADTGALIWKAVGPDDSGTCTDSVTNFCVDGRADSAFSSNRPSLVDSIPSEMAVVDSDNNNIIDRAYVGDSGGNVWRVELTEDKYKVGSTLRDDDNWYVSRLAQLGSSVASEDRRFFHAPDYVKARETDTRNKYDAVIITSGDRANPRETTVNNYAFMIKDPLTVTNASALIKSRDPYVIQNPSTTYLTGLTDITGVCIDGDETETACKALDLTNGWKLKLEAAGEKGLSRPLTTSGVVLFTTYVPNDTTSGDICAPSEGTGRAYLVNLADGSAAFDLAAQINVWTKADRFSEIGPGIPGDIIPYEDMVLIPGKGIGGKQLYTIPGRVLWRVYWREEEVDQ